MESIRTKHLLKLFREQMRQTVLTFSIKEPPFPPRAADLQFVYDKLHRLLRYRAGLFILGVAQMLVKQKHAVEITDELQTRIIQELVKIVEIRKEMEPFVWCATEIFLWTTAEVEERVPSIWKTAQLINDEDDDNNEQQTYNIILAVSETIGQRSQARKIHQCRTLIFGTVMLTFFSQPLCLLLITLGSFS